MSGDFFRREETFRPVQIESAYRYADSCDGTGQRTAILKSSFQPTSVPSVPRNATYKPKSAPKSKSSQRIAAARPHPNVRHTPPPATRGIAAIRKPHAATKADNHSFQRNSKQTSHRSFRRAASHGSARSPPTWPRRMLEPSPAIACRKARKAPRNRHCRTPIRRTRGTRGAHNPQHCPCLNFSPFTLRTHVATRIPTCSRARPRTPTLKPTQPRTVGYVRTQVANTHLEHASQTQRTQVARTSNACESNL